MTIDETIAKQKEEKAHAMGGQVYRNVIIWANGSDCGYLWYDRATNREYHITRHRGVYMTPLVDLDDVKREVDKWLAAENLCRRSFT